MNTFPALKKSRFCVGKIQIHGTTVSSTHTGVPCPPSIRANAHGSSIKYYIILYVTVQCVPFNGTWVPLCRMGRSF